MGSSTSAVLRLLSRRVWILQCALFLCMGVCVCVCVCVQPNEYGLTNPESKSSDQCTAIPMETPDSRIGSERDQMGGRILAALIVDWSPIQKSLQSGDQKSDIQQSMWGWDWISGPDSGFSIHSRLAICVRALPPMAVWVGRWV